jgi:predicted flap endonuclease-1-like 5' DNA nuclease
MSVVVVTLLSLAILVVGFLVGWLVGGLATGLSAIAFMALPVLVIGFLIGWLVEWIIDNQYRRMRELGQVSPAQTVPLPAAAGHEVTELIGTIKEVIGEREKEVNDLRTELEEQQATVEHLKDEFEAYAATHPDDLTAIKGIGRIYQWKLRDAGINTYKTLAASKPDRLREILQFKAWQKVDPASWIDQARALVGTN